MALTHFKLLANVRALIAWAFVLCLGMSEVMAQTNFVDSLEIQLGKLNSPSAKRVDILCQLSYQNYNFNDSIGLYYANRALKEARELNYDGGIKASLTMAGIGLGSNAEYAKAISYLKEAHSIHVPGTDTLDMYSMIVEANVYRDISSYDSALALYDETVKMATAVESWRWLAIARKNIALLRLLQWRNDEGLSEALLALEAVKRVNQQDAEVEVYVAVGKAYLGQYQYDSAALYFEKVCDLSSERDYFNQIRCFLNWCDYEIAHANYSKALEYCYNALKLTDNYVYPPQLSEIYEKLGTIYSELNQYEFASKYFFEALRVCSRFKLRYNEANILSLLGSISKDLKNYNAALDFLARSERLYTEIGSEHGVAYCRNMRGIVLMNTKKYDSAVIELKAAKDICVRIKHFHGAAACASNMGLVYEAQGKLNKAYEMQLESIKIQQRVSNKQSLGFSYNRLAELSLKKEELEKVPEFLRLATNYAIETGSKRLQLNNAHVYAQYYSELGDYKTAFQYQQIFQQLSDSIYTTSNRVKIAERETLYQLEQRDQQIKLLGQEKVIAARELELQRAQIKLQSIVIIAGSIGGALLILLAWNIYRSKKRIQSASTEILEQKEEIQAQSEELIEANQTIAQINRDLEQKVEFRTSELRQAYKELDTFFYRSSHDFRRPLTTFLGLAEVATVTVKDKAALELFDKVKETAIALDRMLVKLQSVSDVGLHELVFKEVFLKDIFDSVQDQYRDIIHDKKIDLTFEEEIKEPFCSYPALIKLIFDNLVENSILFSTPVHPHAHVCAKQVNGELVLTFSDNGQGIDEEYQARIFDMYYRANHQSKGNGLGLYVVYKAVLKLKGRITFESKLHEGTTFTIHLPMSLGA